MTHTTKLKKLHFETVSLLYSNTTNLKHKTALTYTEIQIFPLHFVTLPNKIKLMKCLWLQHFHLKHNSHFSWHCGVFAQSKNCEVKTVSHYYTAVCKQQKNGVFCAVCADHCASNNDICHAINKHQLHSTEE